MGVAVSSPLKFDIKLVGPFVESIRTVFRTMLKTEPRILQPHVKKAESECNVFGIIGFSGELTGAMTLCLNHGVAEKLVEVFTGAPVKYEDPHFADAVGELANMIAGGAKSRIPVSASITVPSVVMGEHCHVTTLSDTACIVLPCDTPLGQFAVEVCVKNLKV